MKWLFSLAFLLLLAGCSHGITPEQAENEVLTGYNNYLSQNGRTERVTKVDLIKKSETEFEGTLTLSDGRTTGVRAVSDGRKITYETTGN